MYWTSFEILAEQTRIGVFLILVWTIQDFVGDHDSRLKNQDSQIS